MLIRLRQLSASGFDSEQYWLFWTHVAVTLPLLEVRDIEQLLAEIRQVFDTHSALRGE